MDGGLIFVDFFQRGAYTRVGVLFSLGPSLNREGGLYSRGAYTMYFTVTLILCFFHEQFCVEYLAWKLWVLDLLKMTLCSKNSNEFGFPTLIL